MDIIVTARKSPTRALIENCLEFYKRELKLTNSSYSLVVMTDRGMGTKEGMRGVVYKLGPKVIGMVIDTALDMERLIITMAHEMVHVKQYARGQITHSKSMKSKYWMGKRVRADYYDQPWEIEAYSKERVLANKVFAMLNEDKRCTKLNGKTQRAKAVQKK